MPTPPNNLQQLIAIVDPSAPAIGIVVIVVSAANAHTLAPLAAVTVAAADGQQAAAIISKLLQPVIADAKRRAVRSVGEAATVV